MFTITKVFNGTNGIQHVVTGTQVPSNQNINIIQKGTQTMTVWNNQTIINNNKR